MGRVEWAVLHHLRWPAGPGRFGPAPPGARGCSPRASVRAGAHAPRR